jgi:uroporphyrinogen decarboxylase
MRFSPDLAARLKEALAVDDLDSHFGMDVRLVPFDAPCPPPDVSRYVGPLPDGAVVNPWGSVSVPGGYYHFRSSIAPMRDFRSSHQIDEYPFPNFLPNLEAMQSRALAIQAEGLAAMSAYLNGPYEQACALRGQAEFLADLAANNEFALTLLDGITDIKCLQATASARCGVDIVWIGDDLGMQDRLVFSPTTWRRFIRPCLERIVASIREASDGCLVAYHSCGHVEPLVAELADAGIQVLESVQPEANDVARLKQQHGHRLSFWGTVGDQSTLPYGTQAEVREEVCSRIETVGFGGGLLISPAHVVEPEVPVENVLAFFEAVEEFGSYS